MAEAFPDVYRTILDGIALLELAGHREEAHRIRAAATAAYSGAWSETGHRRLTLIAARLERLLATPDAVDPAARPSRRGVGSEGWLATLLRLSAPR